MDVSNLRTVSARRWRRTTTVCSTRGSNPEPCPKMKLGALTAKAIPLVVESMIQNIRPFIKNSKTVPNRNRSPQSR